MNIQNGLCSLLLAGALAVPSNGKASTYTFTDLGTLDDTYSAALGINNLGQVVGLSSLSGRSQAFVYSLGSGIEALMPLNEARAINNSGQIAGNGVTPASNGDSRAVIYNQSGFIRDLGVAGERYMSYSLAFAINNVGQVTGDSNGQAYIYSPGIGMVGLGGGGAYTIGLGINDSGHVVGHGYFNGASTDRAFLYTSHNGMQDLGTLGGSSSFALGINNSGVIVGSSYTSTNTQQHAFIYTAADGMVDLDPAGLLGASQALDVNELGQIVGRSDRGAFLYSNDTGLLLLDSLEPSGLEGKTLRDATGINDSGQLVGSATINSGATHAYLLSFNAIPEPATCSLLLAGLGLLCGTQSRKKVLT